MHSFLVCINRGHEKLLENGQFHSDTVLTVEQSNQEIISWYHGNLCAHFQSLLREEAKTTSRIAKEIYPSSMFFSSFSYSFFPASGNIETIGNCNNGLIFPMTQTSPSSVTLIAHHGVIGLVSLSGKSLTRYARPLLGSMHCNFLGLHNTYSLSFCY